MLRDWQLYAKKTYVKTVVQYMMRQKLFYHFFVPLYTYAFADRTIIYIANAKAATLPVNINTGIVSNFLSK